MIRVTIELWPGGQEHLKRHLGTIDIANDATGSATRGNYRARLSRRNNPDGCWKTARVEGFPRKRLGAYDLLFRVLKQVVGPRNKER